MARDERRAKVNGKILVVWTEIENDDGLSYRAILEDYLVFLRLELSKEHRKSKKSRSIGKNSRSTGDWYIHFLIPDEERNKVYLAGEGFSHGTSLERAQTLALEKALELRAAFSRQQKRKAKGSFF